MLDTHTQNTHSEQHDMRAKVLSSQKNPTYLLLCSVHWFLKAFGQDASSRANVAPNVGTLFSLSHLHFWSAGTQAILLSAVSELPSITDGSWHGRSEQREWVWKHSLVVSLLRILVLKTETYGTSRHGGTLTDCATFHRLAPTCLVYCHRRATASSRTQLVISVS